MRVSKLSVTLHSSLTAPMFSIKMRSLLTTRKLSIDVPFSRITSPAGVTASGRISATSWAMTPVSELSLVRFNCEAKIGSYSYLECKKNLSDIKNLRSLLVV